MNTTDTEYTLDGCENVQNSQSHTPVLQPGLSITSLSTGTNTPAQPEFLENESSKMTVEEAVNAIKLFHTALTNWSSKPSSSHSQRNDCSRSGSPLNIEEEDLLQELLTVPSEQNHKDAGTQV